MTQTDNKSSAQTASNAEEEIYRPLAEFKGEVPSAPDWFKRNIEQPYEEDFVEAHGAKIHYLAWGERGKPGLILLHGGRAHAHWWTPFAPFFSSHYRVAAFDLSGMGESEWRSNYSFECFAEEVMAVTKASGAGDAGPPLIVGHSFGGYVSLAAVEQFGERLGGAVIVDTPLLPPNPDEEYHPPEEEKREIRPTRVYESFEEPLMRFRFLPNQPCSNAYLVDYIARKSLREAPLPDKPGQTGWTWRFDPGMGRNYSRGFSQELFRAARCPLAFIYGEQSVFYAPETLDQIRIQTAGRAPIVVMPDVHHHLMMDHPIGFVSALRSLLAAWPVRIGW